MPLGERVRSWNPRRKINPLATHLTLVFRYLGRRRVYYESD